MGTTVFPGRYTALVDGPVVVFMIGMRFNRLWAMRKWSFVMRSMREMTTELEQHPESGFRGAQVYASWRGLAMFQYWRTFEDLERFARDKQGLHLPAWERYKKLVGNDGSVGVWHETFEVKHHEVVYDNMPVFGLAAVGEHVPVSGRLGAARGRIYGSRATPADS